MPDDPEQMTDEQIESALDQAPIRTPGYPPEPEPEPVEETPVEPEAPQVTEEQEQPPEASGEETPAEPEKPAPTEAEPEDLEKAELKATISELEARARKWEQVAGRHGGKLGFLEKQLAALSQRPAAPAPQEVAEYEEPEAPPQQRPSRPTAPASDPMSSWVVQRAIREGATEFQAKYPDYTEYEPAMREYLQKSGYNAASILEANDPMYAQTETTRALEEAYWHVATEARARARAELSERRAAQTAKLKEAKQRAAPSATASAPPPKPRPKTIDQLTDEEVEAEMQKALGDRRWY